MIGTHRRPALVLPVVLLLAFVSSGTAVRAQSARNGTVALWPGCTSVALNYAAGTPLTRIASDVQPPSALRGIFRPEGNGFRAYAPGLPAALSDYRTIGARNETAYFCVGVAASLLLTAPPLEAPPVVDGTVIAVPERVIRPQMVEVQISAGPWMACTGGVNIPIPGPDLRWQRIEAAGGSGGVAVIQFAVLSEDAPGLAHLAVRCAGGQVVRLWIPIV